MYLEIPVAVGGLLAAALTWRQCRRLDHAVIAGVLVYLAMRAVFILPWQAQALGIGFGGTLGMVIGLIGNFFNEDRCKREARKRLLHITAGMAAGGLLAVTILSLSAP